MTLPSEKGSELIFIQSLVLILFSFLLRDCYFIEVDARSLACSHPPGFSGCEGVDRERTAKSSEVSQPACSECPHPVCSPTSGISPCAEEPGKCACRAPVWGSRPVKHGQLLQGTHRLLCTPVSGVTGRGCVGWKLGNSA